MWMCLLKMYLDLELMRNIKMIRYMSGIMEYHGSMKIHGLMMEYGLNLSIIFIMNAIHFVSKMGLLNGLLEIGRKTGTATLETYMDSFEKAIQLDMKTMNVMDHSETQGKRRWFDEHELIGDNDDDIGDLEDYLIQKDPP
ncbi:hypothetical protein Tco_1151693 [Tanacetum coccineum]